MKKNRAAIIIATGVDWSQYNFDVYRLSVFCVFVKGVPINKISNEKNHEKSQLYLIRRVFIQKICIDVPLLMSNIQNVCIPSLSIHILISVKQTRQPSNIVMNTLRLKS